MTTRNRRRNYDDEPSGPGEGRGRERGELTDREIENRLTQLETWLGLGRWLIGIGVAAVAAVAGGLIAVSRVLD